MGRGRRRTLAWAVAVGALGLACAPPSPPSQPSRTSAGSATAGEEPEAIARGLVEALATGDGYRAVDRFDARMQQALPERKALEAWQAVEAQAGRYQSVEAVESRRSGGFRVELVRCRMERGAIVTKVVFDAAGLVAGLFFLPGSAMLEWQPPSYVDEKALVQREVDVGSSPALPGVLTLPASGGAAPVVVLVHGSGPSDRDETVGGTKVFRDLAEGLATRGVASLRYDKRSLVAPEGIVTEKEEAIDPALSAIALLRSTAGVDPTRIVIVGHSQGGALAPHIAQLDGGLAGVVVLAGPTRPLEDSLVAQLAYLASSSPEKPGLEEARRRAVAFKALVEAPGLRPDADLAVPGGGHVKGAYFLAARERHPERDAASLACPVLVLQGGRDYKVTATDDFARWREALAGRPDAVLKLYPDLDHHFVSGDGPSTPAQYETPSHVDARVVADIADWVTRLAPRSTGR